MALERIILLESFFMPVSGDNSLFFSTGLDNSGLLKGSLQAQGIISNMGRQISRINPFAAIGVAAIAAFAVVSREAYNLAKDFEHAMREVETISDATQANFKGISSQVFELSTTSPDGPVELAQAYYQIVSAGHDGAAGLRLLETASKAAVGGVTDTKTAADGLTTILNAWGIEAERVSEVSDVLFTTVKLGKTTFEELSNSISVVAPLASATGVGLNQVTGAVATLTKQGTPTTVAMTQIRQAMIALTENLGDGWAETYTFQEALGVLVQRANGSQNELKKLVGRIEGVNAVLALTGENAQGASEDLQAMSESAGAAEQAFQTLVNDTTNQWKILGNRIRAITKELGEATLAASGGIVRFFNDVLRSESDATKAIKDQQIELVTLESKIKNVNTSEKGRIKLIDELKTKYPNLLKDIDSERISNIELAKSLSQINEQLVNRLVIQAKQDEIDDKAYEASKSKIDLIDEEANILETITKLSLKHGLTIKDNATLYEQALDIYDNLPNSEKDQGILIDDGPKLALQLRNLKALENFSTKAQGELDNLLSEKEDLTVRLGIKIENIDNDGLSEEVQKIIDEVKSIDFNDFKVNQDIFAPYLKSAEEAVRKIAEARLRVLTNTLNGEEEDQTELERFQNKLDLRKAQYNSLYTAIESGEKDLAEKLKAQYGLNEESYIDYLRNLFEETEKIDLKSLILDQLDSIEANIRERDLAQAVNEITPKGLVLDFKIDTTSINALNGKLGDLEKEFNAAITQSARDALKIKIDLKKKEIEDASKGVKTKEELEREFYNKINTYSRQGLIDLKNQKKQELKVIKDNLGEASDEYQKLADEIKKINEETGQDFATIASQIGDAFSGAADLLSNLGVKDETTELIEQIAGAAEGAARIASGDVIGGSIQVLKSAIRIEVESDTANFEKAIESLEKNVTKLERALSKAFGSEEAKSRIDLIREQEEIQRNLVKAIEAEEKAKRKVKFLGVDITKAVKFIVGGIEGGLLASVTGLEERLFGEGTGTDPKKIEAFREQIEAAKNEIEDVQDELNGLLTGTTPSNITDSIIDGFKNGKLAAEDFADNFENLMRDAVLQSFELSFLKDASEKFFKEFAASSDSNNDGISDLTPQEITRLRASFNGIVQRSEEELEALNEILNQAGIAGGVFGIEDQRQEGLPGGIKTITEDTANILAGTINSIRIDIKTGLEIAQQSSLYLSEIALNTSYNVQLERMEAVELSLKNIEEALT